MRFENQPGSHNIEDRRGGAPPGRRGGNPFGGGGMRLPMGRGGGMGLGGLVVLLLVAWMLGVNPLTFLGGGGSTGYQDTTTSAPSAPARESAEEARLRQFVSQVLATTEECWGALFREKFGKDYEPPKLVLFRNAVDSACGFAESAVGPFYCPGDRKVYIDLSFLDEMGRTLGANGDFAQAYVVAHEVGHHVQNLLGTNRQVSSLRARGASEREQNQASVQLELQADYFAGVWANYVDRRMKGRVTLEVGDYDEAIRAAQAVGDDVLQRRATGRVVPEKFTHGSAAQRSKWFKVGFETGDPLARDPFKEEK